jgi:hypothetical protein
MSAPDPNVPPSQADLDKELGQGSAADSTLLEELATVALTPVTIRKIFILLTRLHYSDPDHFGSLKPKLSKFVWNADIKLRGIHVDFDYNYDPNNTDLRPAVFVGTSDIDFQKVAVNNQQSQTDDRSGEIYVKRAGTNIILRHIGKTPDETWALADMTSQFYMGITKMLQERLKVSSFEVVKLMGSKPFERKSQEADSQFIVDLIMNLQYNAAWLTTREGHRIKTITYAQSLADFTVSE